MSHARPATYLLILPIDLQAEIDPNFEVVSTWPQVQTNGLALEFAGEQFQQDDILSIWLGPT